MITKRILSLATFFLFGFVWWILLQIDDHYRLNLVLGVEESTFQYAFLTVGLIFSVTAFYLALRWSKRYNVSPANYVGMMLIGANMGLLSSSIVISSFIQ